MKVQYTYYWNMQKDEQGRFTALCDGFMVGDSLCVAYEGELEVSEQTYDADIAIKVLDELYYRFNTMERPRDYHGPSMSVGSVVRLTTNLSQTYFRRDRVGWNYLALDEISASPIVGTPKEWRAQW